MVPVPVAREITGPLEALIVIVKVSVGPALASGRIGTWMCALVVPTGIVGPLNIIGTDAKGDFFVPLATSEGALVASYDRGARATRLSGGIASICLVQAARSRHGESQGRSAPNSEQRRRLETRQ